MATEAAPPTTDLPEADQSDSSKLRTFIGLLRKFIGVADLASVRFSLPSQLLEPTPNLEYWNYLDAPNAFVAIGTADDSVERMLEVVRFWATKDLKWAKGKPCKPYNSCLGEFFRCNYDTEDNAPKISIGDANTGGSKTGSAASSIKSGKLAISSNPGSSGSRGALNVSIPQSSPTPTTPTVRVSYLTEQTSHHPPVSAFYVDCPEKGLRAMGYDQITAKFTGTSIKVSPGEHNLGIFITSDKRDGETYQLKHPAAHLGGILRGALSVSVADMAYITCPQTKLKAILNYYDDGWLRGPTNKVEGIIFKYDPDHDTTTKVKDVPDADVLVRLSGEWKEKIEFTTGPKPFTSQPAEAKTTLLDLGPLSVAPKIIPPEAEQLPNESIKLWGGVTKAIQAKQFNKATTIKQELEEAQREKAREREKSTDAWKPVFFEQSTSADGKPELTAKGRELLKRAQEGKFDITDIVA